jgi:predicted flap endonuclease-1-like 5' DNA nuclease
MTMLLITAALFDSTTLLAAREALGRTTPLEACEDDPETMTETLGKIKVLVATSDEDPEGRSRDPKADELTVIVG